MNTNFTRTNFLTYFYDKNPKVRTKMKIGMLVNTAPGFQCISLVHKLTVAHICTL